MIQINLPLVKRMFRRLVSRRFVDIRDLAQKQWMLCPAEEGTSPPAIHLPGETDRIFGVSPWRTREGEFAAVTGGRANHDASYAHLIPNVELVDAYLYCGPALAQPGFGRRRLFRQHTGPVQRFAEAHLITHSTGSHFFGSLMLDDYPIALLPHDDADCIQMSTQPYEHDGEYRKLLKLRSSPPVRRARIDRLILYTDFAQNSLKATRYRELRRRLRASLPGAKTTAEKRVYLRRGRTGELRLLENERQIEQVLTGLGFDILDHTQMSATEMARRSLDADLIVAVEGSHLSHAIFSAADDACFMVLQPPTRFATAYKEYTDRMNMRFAFLVGDPSRTGFTVDPDHLQRLLEHVANVREKAA